MDEAVVVFVRVIEGDSPSFFSVAIVVAGTRARLSLGAAAAPALARKEGGPEEVVVVVLVILRSLGAVLGVGRRLGEFNEVGEMIL